MPGRSGLLPSDALKVAMGLGDLAERVRILEARTHIPPSAATLLRTANQSIPNGIGTKTPIEWSSIKSGPGFSWSSGVDSGRRLYLISVARSGTRIEITGQITFDANATGRRAAFLSAYKASDNTLRESVAFFDLFSGDANHPFVSPVALGYEYVDPSDYLKFEVSQSSGAGLNLTFASITAKLIK